MTRQTNRFKISHNGHNSGIRLGHPAIFPLILVALLIGNLCACAETVVITNAALTHAGWESFRDVPLPAKSEETRFFKAEIAFTATASNNVQIAFGKDADKDGKLPAEETSMTVGWDGGVWFILSPDLLHKFTSTPLNSGAVTNRTLKMSMRLNASGNPISLSFRDQGGSAITFDGLTGIPAWMSPKEWDMAALTARGWDARDEAASISFVLDGTHILLR